MDPSNEAFYNANGFYITDPDYDLRPEVIESFYYAYRITGKAVMPFFRGKSGKLIALKGIQCIKIGRGRLSSL